MLLILSSDKDLTADFLIVELLRRKLPYFRINTEELASASYTFSLGSGPCRKELTVGPRTLDIQEVAAVWYRRAIHPIPDQTHSPAERSFVAGELRHLATGMMLNSKVTWVNPIDKVFIAEHKLYQLQIAQQLGFQVPRTIVSGNLSTLRDFAAANSGGTICKPIFHGMFVDRTSRYSIYTRRITPDSFDEISVSLCPVLLQEEIPRGVDVRATFIGDECFVVDIKRDNSCVDWRHPDASIRYSVTRLGDSDERMCRAMMTELGLAYGAFDFVRTPDGRLVFLEINPTGEWAWLEDRLGFPMRDAFVQLFFGRWE